MKQTPNIMPILMHFIFICEQFNVLQIHH